MKTNSLTTHWYRGIYVRISLVLLSCVLLGNGYAWNDHWGFSEASSKMELNEEGTKDTSEKEKSEIEDKIKPKAQDTPLLSGLKVLLMSYYEGQWPETFPDINTPPPEQA